MKKHNKFFLLIISFLLSISSFCFAINELDTENTNNLSEIGAWGFNFILSISVLAAFGVLVWAGFIWLTSAGDVSKIGEAKTKIKAAIMGILVIFFSYLIITTINPDLMVFNIKTFELPENTTTGTTPSTPDNTTNVVYQEIPLGQLTENILAKNISCFNGDGDLVNCKDEEEIIQSAPEEIFSEDNDIYFCYEYDSNGNKKGVLENKDRFYCYGLFLDAAETKINKMIDLMKEIETLSKSCACSRCSGGSPIKCISGSCGVACIDLCSCCGSPRNAWDPFCGGPFSEQSHTDPCSNRDSIDTKREELHQLIYGDTGDLAQYKRNDMDPEITPTFVTIQNIKQRLELMKEDFEKELTSLSVAESLMMYPSGDRISRNEFNSLKTKQAALNDKVLNFTSFEDQSSTASYCKEYNCIDSDNDGFKENCSFNDETRYCKNNEGDELSTEGDPATFYFNENETRNYLYSDLTCTIEAKTEEGILKGLIPIGETVDGTEDFIAKIISSFDNFIKNIQKEIVEGGIAYTYPESCHCGNCGSSAITESECCSCCNCDECTCSSKSDCDCLGCTTCAGEICPYATIRNAITEAENIFSAYTYNESAKTLLNIKQTLVNYKNLTQSKGLAETDPDRFALFNLLDISRERLDKCFTKYNFEGSTVSAIMDTISCESILNWRNKGYLTTYPDFILTEDQGYFDCYPYNTDETLRGSCVINIDSLSCLKLRSTYMNNYYCCND
jgi:hypothetical protein